MMPHTAYVGLGSNALDACSRLSQAAQAIVELSGSTLVRTSRVYHTEPQGYRDQPWFENSVVQFTFASFWEPKTLLSALLSIEASLGRVRLPEAQRFGPRTIDIDLLLFDEQVSEDPFCILPHPRMQERAFVLAPLEEIAPDLLLYGKPISWYLERIPWRREGRKIFQAEG